MNLFGFQTKTKHLFLAASLGLSVLTAGCSSNDKPADQVTELNVLLDWYPNAVHSFLFAAQKEGYFEKEGLKVNLQTPADTNDAIKLLAAGKADLAISYQMQVAQSRAEGIPVVSVAALVRHPLNQLFTLNSSGVERPKQLEGKKVGYPSIPLDEELVKTMVEADGGDPAKVEFVDIGWDLIPAMTTGRVDAIIGGYINHEKLLMEKEGVALTAYDPSKFGVPDYNELVLTASDDGLKKNEDVIRRFLKAAAQGQQYTKEHPDDALKILLDHADQSFPLDPEVEKQSLGILLPLMDDGSAGFGAQSADSWQAVIDWLKAHGQLQQDVKAEDAFRNL